MSIYFYYFPIISPLGRAWPFIWTNLNPLYPGILCAKFGWNWPSGPGEEDENVKSLQTDRQTDRRTDGRTEDGRHVIRKAHLSLQLKWAKKYSRTKSEIEIQSVADILTKIWECIILIILIICDISLRHEALWLKRITEQKYGHIYAIQFDGIFRT